MENKLSYKTEVFEGPLDLLLQLIARHKLNIYDIPISQLLEQYMEQIERMRSADMDIQSEFFEMAARLVHIKTVMLLPHQEEAEELKKELTGQIIEYQLCCEMAAKLSKMACFDEFVRQPMKITFDKTYRRVHDSDELVNAYISAVGRGKRRMPPPQVSFSGIVARKIVPVNVKISYVLQKVYLGKSVKFNDLFIEADSKSELVATFLAVLELVKSKRIEFDDKNGTVKLINGDKEDGYQTT